MRTKYNKKVDKYEFLPSALEIIEKPSSPVGRGIIWIIFIFILFIVVWSIVSKVDVVSNARGKIIPSGKLKTIQPLEEGIIKKIYVEEGQSVKKGDLLVEFDSTMKKADTVVIKKTLALYKLELELKEHTIKDKFVKIKDILNRYKDVDTSKIYSEYNAYISEKKVYESALNEIKLTMARSRVELQKTISSLNQAKNKYSLLKIETKSYNQLKELGGVTEHDWLAKQTEMKIAQEEIAIKEAECKSIEIIINETEAQLENHIRKHEFELNSKILELQREILYFEGNLTKIQKQYELKKIYSPADGRINQIGITTVGGIATPASVIMTVVPEKTPLVAELLVLNKDIGFVEIGQIVEMKLDTFPFQRHGLLVGSVVRISPDAYNDEKLGLVYKVVVDIKENNVTHNGKIIQLVSGLSMTGEIKTGKRRVIEFFLSPIIKYKDESLKVR